MTNYASDRATPPVGPSPAHGQAMNIQQLYCIVNVGAALTTADTFSFFTLPPNARILSCRLKVATAMDTNGSPTLTINVGTAATAALYLSASTVARAGGNDANIVNAGLLSKTSAKTPVIGSVGANAATGVAGTIELHMSFTVEDSPTSP